MIIIRPAEPRDLDALVLGNAELARETEDTLLDQAVLRAGIAALLADPAKGWYLVAEVDGQVVGQIMLTFEWSDWRNGCLGWLQSVWVAPDHRRQGVFSALLAGLIERARAADIVGLRLYVEEHNTRAQEVYRRHGFAAAGYLVYHRDGPL
ncbi:MAG: GNAT family N-acetyltransferase [Fimbriimonadaceae bacterium]|nr:GNAT family N-acetyltransferase [Fimbriimonadaceae bacterium]